MYALASVAGPNCADALLAVLQQGDWRAQIAAADLAGAWRLTTAVPALLALFAEGEAELPYPPLNYWWRWSEMLRNPQAQEGVDTTLPMPLAEKRWKLKRAVVTALGQLGDPRAVAPLETALHRCDDFFPVTAQLASALGRLGSPTSIPVLALHLEHA